MASRKQRDEWDAEQKRMIIRELGRLPEKAEDLPKLYCEQKGLYIDLTQTVLPTDIPEIEDNPEGMSREELQDRNQRRNAGTVRTTVHELQRRLELLNRDVPMGYTQEAIRNAIAEYMYQACIDLASGIMRDVTHDPDLADDPDVQYSWEQLAFAVFDEPRLTLDAQIAVLQGAIWQCKRKMTGSEVTQHFMLVLIGKQGAGKDTFLRHFLGPLKSGARLNMTVAMALEQRLIDLWRFAYAICFPEMERMDNADKDAVKNMITADTFTRRPMRTNFDVVVGNNAVFFGSANDHFSEMVKDSTGNRRFIPCDVQRVLDWDIVNNTDYLRLWQSVDERNPQNPAVPYWDQIAVLQEYHRVKSPTEEWCRRMQDDEELREQFTAWRKQADLYTEYRKWERKEALPAKDRTSRRLFYEEMADMVEEDWSLWERHEDEEQYRINEDK